MDIERHKTAISRSNVNVPTRWAFDQGVITSKSNVYDWGCGKGKDSEWLKEQGCDVISHDPFHAPENDPDSVDFKNIDVIICNYVVNVIECPQTRIDLIKKMKDIAKSHKIKLVISARPESQIKSEAKKNGWKKYGDGFITSRKTFQKGFSLEQLNSLVRLEAIKSHKTSGGIVCVY